MSTQLIYIDYDKGKGLEKEIEVHRKQFATFSETEYLSNYPTSESYFRDWVFSIHGIEFQKQIEKFSASCRVLDVGAGRGKSSIYLASKGHRVSVVEPSLEYCRLVKSAADLYGLSLTIYNCNAESIHKIDKLFDLVIFNASFHHCDEPIKVLANCYNSLVEGGKTILVNEPILQFYKTKQSFYERLETHPEEMGHYGGNEHIYRFQEYVAMLKTGGFKNIAIEPHVCVTDYQLRVQQAEVKTSQGKPLYNSKMLLLKKTWYYWGYKFKNGGLLGKLILGLLKRLSMLPATFIASK